MKLKKFYAEWCNPCKVMAKRVAEVADKFPALEVEEIDVEESPEKAEKYGVRNLPTIVIEDEEGNVVGTLSGIQSVDKIASLITNKFN